MLSKVLSHSNIRAFATRESCMIAGTFVTSVLHLKLEIGSRVKFINQLFSQC